LGHPGSRFTEYRTALRTPPVYSGGSTLSGHVLVLNNDYRALTVTSVQRATVLVLLQKADLVEANDRRFIRSASFELPWPSIVRLRIYVRVPYKKIMLTRKNVMRRDGSQCQYCGSRDRLTIDHVRPKSRGGRETWDNLVTACVPCNNTKGNKTPDEADMKLSRKPFRPSYVMYIRDFVGSMDDTWKPYLFLS
jgi:5-methylcytosine-specific restriction endonuclease McrA